MGYKCKNIHQVCLDAEFSRCAKAVAAQSKFFFINQMDADGFVRFYEPLLHIIAGVHSRRESGLVHGLRRVCNISRQEVHSKPKQPSAHGEMS